MPEIPTTLELAARAVLSHPWGSGPWSAHTEHRYDIECAVCQGDVRRVLTVALTTAADHAHQLASSHASEHDALRQRYADALSRSLTSPQRGMADHLDAVLAVRDDELSRALRIADYHAGQHRQAADILARLFPSIECVLIDHADELDDAQGRVDANLSELAHVCRELTGFDARTVTTEETSS